MEEGRPHSCRQRVSRPARLQAADRSLRWQATPTEPCAAGCPLGYHPSAMDPVIEAYKKDVDRTLIRENLRRTVEERILQAEELQRTAEELRRVGRAARSK